MTGVDRPVNIFPCGHVLWPIATLYFLARESRKWLIPLLPLFLFGTITIVTTWQHRPVDVLVGIGLSLGAIWLATRIQLRRYP
jgi:membrane-associated phospholipid phosphatase